MEPGQVLFLTDADVRACALSAGEVNAAVDAMFAAKTEGRTIFKPQLVLELDDARLILAKSGVIPPYAATKWLGVYPGNARHGVPDFHPLVFLNDATTGLPLAIMDGRWITGVRTAAISAVAAKYLARPAARTLGIVACGLQAQTHLAAFAAEFPLRRIQAWSRTRASAERFATEAKALGFEAEIADTPRAAIEGADLVASLVADIPDLEPFLDATWLKPGSFVALVDMGRPWRPESFARLDKVVTDDHAQNSAGDADAVAYPPPFYAEIGELVLGRVPCREHPDERNGVVFNGIGLADLAVASALYERARARGLGWTLPT